MTNEHLKVIAGIDTHADTHHVAIISETGRHVARVWGNIRESQITPAIGGSGSRGAFRYKVFQFQGTGTLPLDLAAVTTTRDLYQRPV